MSEQHSSGLPIVPQESFELNRVASLGATWDPSTGCLHLAHMLGGSWVSTLLILTMKETLWLVRACPHGFPRLSLCPWVSQSCTAPSGLRLSTCHLHSCGSNEVKEQTVPVYSPRGSDVLCSINNLVRWTELDWFPAPQINIQNDYCFRVLLSGSARWRGSLLIENWNCTPYSKLLRRGLRKPREWPGTNIFIAVKSLFFFLEWGFYSMLSLFQAYNLKITVQYWR